jgi:hypothetical protein
VNSIRLAIPLHGKMVYRSLHTPEVQAGFLTHGIEPFFYVDDNHLVASDEHYAKLQVGLYQKLLNQPFMQMSVNLRWFMAQTQSTESRFRNLISDSVWDSDNLTLTLARLSLLNFLHKLNFLAKPLIWCEEQVYKTDYHLASLKEKGINCTLISGVGSKDFEMGGLFAREARQTGLPVISAINNYDNLLSKGHPNLIPDRVAVWSKKMEMQATELLGIPAKRVVVVGPTVFDRYFQPLAETREEFLQKLELDARQKTLFYAGHTSIVTYFDFLDLVLRLRQPGNLLADCNLIIRPYPHSKVHNWTGIRFFREKLAELPNVYLSDPFKSSSDALIPLSKTPAEDKSTDELHAILKYSDVMVNYFSTLGLEAAICDVPTIHIGYDKFTYHISPMAWSSTGARNTHNQDQQRRAASKVVTSDEELVSAIETYLQNRALDREERREYALSECGYLDGKSMARLAELVAETTATFPKRQA